MSNLTRAQKYNRVRFKDTSGKDVTGVCLYFRSDHIVVGVQSTVKPMVYGKIHGRDKNGESMFGWVPNRSLWVVPFASVIETLSQEQANAA